jgi:hypothetical protein
MNNIRSGAASYKNSIRKWNQKQITTFGRCIFYSTKTTVNTLHTNNGAPAPGQSACTRAHREQECRICFIPPINARPGVSKNVRVGFEGFEVLTAVVMQCSIIWDKTSFRSLKVGRRFGGTSHLRNVGRVSTGYTALYSRLYNS